MLRAVAVMHVEVHDRHPLQAVLIERMVGCDGNVIEKAETHGTVFFSVMTRRAHPTEGLAGLVLHHQVHGHHRRPRRPQGRVQRVRRHGGVIVHPHHTLRRGSTEYVLNICLVVHRLQQFPRDQWCVIVMQSHVQAGGEQPVIDCAQPRRPLRVMMSHIVQLAVGVG